MTSKKKTPGRFTWRPHHFDDEDGVSTLALGAAVRLRSEIWKRDGAPLPNSDRELAKIARIDWRTFARNRNEILRGFVAVDPSESDIQK